MLHDMTKPRPGGAQIIEDVFEDAQLLRRKSEKTRVEGTLAT